MKTSISFFISFVLIFLAFSCTKYEDIQSNGKYSTDNEHIKSVSSNGTINHLYLYDHAGKIVEENCLLYFKRYSYDENDRLVKVESAFDDAIYSSTFVERRTEFMTSQNSAVKSYSLYEYDNKGRLSKIENYANLTGKEFEYRSMKTFEYERSNIVKVNLCDPSTGKVAQYWLYTYDNQGNVINEKYYSNNFDYNEELIRETSYKYDKYENPYRIFSILGSPGLFMNVNNIIETNSILYLDVPGIDKYSTGKNTYQYNENGYSVKVNESGNVFEYNY